MERWLLEIESIQWDSIRTLTVLSLEEYTKLPRKQWLLNWPAQVILGMLVCYVCCEGDHNAANQPSSQSLIYPCVHKPPTLIIPKSISLQ